MASTKLIQHYDASRKPCSCVTHKRAGIPCVPALVVGEFDHDDEPTLVNAIQCGECGERWNYYPAKEVA